MSSSKIILKKLMVQCDIRVYLHKMFSTRLGQISKDTDKLGSFWGEKPGDRRQKCLIKVKERFQET